MADQYGRHSDIMTQLLRHVASPSLDADVEGNIFRRTIYPPSVVVIALIFFSVNRVSFTTKNDQMT